MEDLELAILRCGGWWFDKMRSPITCLRSSTQRHLTPGTAAIQLSLCSRKPASGEPRAVQLAETDLAGHAQRVRGAVVSSEADAMYE